MVVEHASRARVAVLGGGCGALAAAFELTQPGWRDHFEVTVYQMGWRLGGKCATGRSMRQGYGRRIEEHGLHVWAGFYDQAFAMMRQCYDELNRGPDVPIRTVGDAFMPQDRVALAQQVRPGEWKWHEILFPQRPGDPRLSGPVEPADPGTMCQLLVDWLREDFCTCVPEGRVATLPGFLDLPVEVVDMLRGIEPFWESPGDGARGPQQPWMMHVHVAHTLVRAFVQGHVLTSRATGQVLAHLLGVFLDGYLDHLSRIEAGGGPDQTLRKIAVDLAAAALVGLFRDSVVVNGFESIDHLELRQWLRSHGARDASLDSFVMRAAYDYTFAYRGGDPYGSQGDGVPATAQMAAGTGLKGTLRLLLDYRGHIFWHLKSGMGEAMFAPLYEVLKNRGVDFRFFHRVDALETADGPDGQPYVARVTIGRQAQIRGGGRYDPLMPVGNLPCWPSRPLWEQFERAQEFSAGTELSDGGFDLERPDTAWQDAGSLVLEAGKDFDHLVLGIPIGALGPITAALRNRSPRWRDMLREVKTVPTLALQLWAKPSAAKLEDAGTASYGRRSGQPALLTSYAQPFNSWADLSHLLVREAWPARAAPKSVHYFCGPLREADLANDPVGTSVRQTAEQWLIAHIGELWPGAPADPKDALFVAPGVNVSDPLDAQFWRANVRPSERYVQFLPGSTAFRLNAAESQFSNLLLAGDWVRTELSAGCVECAVMAGRDAAAGLIDKTRPRYWETELVREGARVTTDVVVRMADSMNDIVQSASQIGRDVMVVSIRGLADLAVGVADVGSTAVRTAASSPAARAREAMRGQAGGPRPDATMAPRRAPPSAAPDTPAAAVVESVRTAGYSVAQMVEAVRRGLAPGVPPAATVRRPEPGRAVPLAAPGAITAVEPIMRSVGQLMVGLGNAVTRRVDERRPPPSRGGY